MVDPENVPPMVRTVRRWDLAFSDRDGSDWISGAKLGIDEREHVYILHVRRVHGRWTQGKPVIIETAQADGIDCTVYIESNGTQLGYADDIKSDSRMRNRTVLEDRPEGNKEMRASIWGTRLVDGIIHCVRGEWNGELFDQMDYFPSAEHDDDVDAISGAYAKLTDVQRIFVA
jgi:predicted phage terminase large subunit-like protein